MVELSVVIPVYQCRECLRPLYRRVRSSVEQITDSFEIVFVDDRSPDRAWGLLNELADTDPAVKAVRLSRNFGQHAAITAGLSRSIGRWVVVMDCDLEEPPEAIPHLYSKALEGFDVVHGVRRRPAHSRLRTAGSRTFRRLSSGSRARRDYATLSVVSRSVVDEFLKLKDIDREYLLILDWLGFEHAAVEFDQEPRPAGRSSYTLSRLVRVALDGMFFQTTVLLRWIVFLGFGVALAGVGLAAFDIYDHFTATSPPGYTSLAVLVLLLGGFIIVSVGVVGLYVGRIFDQVRERPLFVVEEELGAERADGEPSRAPSLGRET
jgi:polyisoprenyl-phosphate glycosyltransferase